MSDHVHDPLARNDSAGCATTLDLPPGEVVEVPLLLPGWQMSALERAAHKRGLTAGEMVRHLLRDFFSGALASRSPDSQASSPCKIMVG